MKMKIVIAILLLVVICILCYVAIYAHTKAQFAAASDFRYNETAIREVLAQSGIDSSSWDNFEPYVAPQEGLKIVDKIDSLPGQPEVSFSQYSGYVTVDGQTGRELFYYFVESPKRRATKPLVLWLNGGPAFSSLIGAMVEIGPFRVKRDGATLGVNPYAWNKVANIIFLEMPAGVGFSYSSTTSDYKLMGDKLTAQDTYTFLINWFERFPTYKNREFYIAGEAYAGHYAPQLARIILQKNKKETATRVINLRGVAVENGIIDDSCRDWGVRDFLYKRGVISNDLRDTLKVCGFRGKSTPLGLLNILRCESASHTYNGVLQSPDVEAFGAPTCGTSPRDVKFDTSKFDLCTEEYANTYLNNPQVQNALHAKATEWGKDSFKVKMWKEEEPTVLLTIKELMASGLRIWLYGGDTDMQVPVEETECAINALALSIKTDRHLWYNAPNEVGGYATEYHNLTFVTVKGVGYSVPNYQPAKAFTVFSSFLQGKPLSGAKS